MAYRLEAYATLKSSGGRPRQIAASNIRRGRDTLQDTLPRDPTLHVQKAWKYDI